MFTYRSRTRANRLHEGELAFARDQRLNEVYMWSIIREFFVYICFIWILYVISYTNRDNNGFLQVNHLRNFFLNTNNYSYDFTKVRIVFFDVFFS